MPSDLQSALPLITPLAIAWAERKSREILAMGEALTATELELAGRMGVRDPNRIRIQMVDVLPLPEEPFLAQMALSTGLMGHSASLG